MIVGFFIMVFLAVTALFFFTVSEQIKKDRNNLVGELTVLTEKFEQLTCLSDVDRTKFVTTLTEETKLITERYNNEILIHQLETLALIAMFFLTLVGTHLPEKRDAEITDI